MSAQMSLLSLTCIHIRDPGFHNWNIMEFLPFYSSPFKYNGLLFPVVIGVINLVFIIYNDSSGTNPLLTQRLILFTIVFSGLSECDNDWQWLTDNDWQWQIMLLGAYELRCNILVNSLIHSMTYLFTIPYWSLVSTSHLTIACLGLVWWPCLNFAILFRVLYQLTKATWRMNMVTSLHSACPL